MANEVRTIGVVTVARSDYGINLPLLRKIEHEPSLALCLIVAGTHLAKEFGLTVRDIEADGFKIAERLEMAYDSDSPEGIARSMGIAVTKYAECFARSRPDILVLLGDRFEMHAAGLAALPFKIPVAHIHGGELTEGAIDDALRHSLTKLSHLHFVAAEDYARRVRQLGEECWRIKVTGAPGLDNLHSTKLLAADELEKKFDLKLPVAPLLVSFHPVTLEFEQAAWQAQELLAALDMFDLPVVFTSPNADTGNRVIKQLLRSYVNARDDAFLVDNLGTQAYFSLMKIAAAMVGNSSSGIIEAPAFKLPVVNIGTRQLGRLKAANVIDVGYERLEIAQGIREAITSDFRDGLRGLINPYGDGSAAESIVQSLKTVAINDTLLKKHFQDL